MADVFTPAERSAVMRAVRSRDTQPELRVRRAAHALGLRFRLHRADLPGKPDLVFPARRIALFVHGCFWHGHDCSFYRLPQTRADFWLAKIETNQKRDAKVMRELYKSGWRQLVIWECAIRGKKAEAVKVVIDKTEKWIRSKRRFAEIRGP